MSVFFTLLWMALLIAFIVYWRKKVKAKKRIAEYPEEYAKISKTKRIIGIACIVSLVLGIATAEPPSEKDNTATSEPTTKQETQQKQEPKVDKQAAYQELLQILGSVPQVNDEVEQQTWYTTFGESHSPETAIHYDVCVKDKDISDVHIHIVQFTSDTEWVFWDKLIFANNGKKWEKTLNCIAGQQGDGKSTQVVMGGKYEIWIGSIKDVKPGLELLTNGNKPILRLSGKYQADVYPTDADMQRVRDALRLQEIIELLDHKLP